VGTARWRGAPDLTVRVYSRLGFPGDAGEVVAAAELWSYGAGARSSPRRRSSRLCWRAFGGGLAGVALARWASPCREFWSSRLLPRARVACSGGAGKFVEDGGDGSGSPDPWRPCTGVQAPRVAEAFLQLLPPLWYKLLQVSLLAPASRPGLYVGEIRGVSPADLRSISFRSRRPRRVETAATSTRFLPLKYLSGNTAAAGDASSCSPARQRIGFCAEDPKGLVVIFCFSRVLSVLWGQLSHVWTVLVISSFLT
jgi:hypothetical protein